MEKKLLSLDVCNEYIEKLAAKHSLSAKVKDLLLNQIRILREKYGNEIPKVDFLELVGKQLELMKTGYLRNQVSMEEFLLSTEYLNLSNTIRPVIRDELIDLFDNHNERYEVCLYGATRYGKTYFSCAGLASCVYHLSCLASPQTHYRLSPNSEIVVVFQSVNELKANRNFREFKGMIEASPYFQKYFPPQGKSKNYLRFPHNIVVKPAPSSNTAVMSENCIAGFLDELSFMKVIRGSRHQGTDEQYYDQAMKLYTTLKSRIENQFKDFATNTWPGKLFLASSANHKDDFLNQKKEEAGLW